MPIHRNAQDVGECLRPTVQRGDRHRLSSLRSGKTKSCGCGRAALKHDLTNQTFGFLQVIEPVKNEQIKGNETRWKCVCQNCGRTVEVSSYWLRHSDPYGHCNCTRFNKPLRSPQSVANFKRQVLPASNLIVAPAALQRPA